MELSSPPLRLIAVIIFCPVSFLGWIIIGLINSIIDYLVKQTRDVILRPSIFIE